MVAAVEMLEPEQAAKMEQETLFVCSSQAGIGATRRSSARYMRSAIPLRWTSSPINMKSGMATSRNQVYVSQTRLDMMLASGASENTSMSSRAKLTSAPETYRPAKKKTVIKVNAPAMAEGATPPLCKSGLDVFPSCSGLLNSVMTKSLFHNERPPYWNEGRR